MSSIDSLPPELISMLSTYDSGMAMCNTSLYNLLSQQLKSQLRWEQVSTVLSFIQQNHRSCDADIACAIVQNCKKAQYLKSRVADKENHFFILPWEPPDARHVGARVFNFYKIYVWQVHESCFTYPQDGLSYASCMGMTDRGNFEQCCSEVRNWNRNTTRVFGRVTAVLNRLKV